MEHHLTEDELKGYETGSMTASALLSADRHLAECAVCRYELRRTVAAPPLPELARAMAEPVHLTYEQMSAHVDASLSEPDRLEVESHTAICRRCARELKELRAFDAQIETELNAVLIGKKVVPGESWLIRLRGQLANYLAVPHRMGFAVAGIALVAIGVFSLLQATGAGIRSGGSAMAHVSAASVATHPQWFYGGFVVAACGIAVLLYGLFKR